MTISLIHAVSNSQPMLGFGLPAGGEWIVLLVLGLLIFGRRLDRHQPPSGSNQPLECGSPLEWLAKLARRNH